MIEFALRHMAATTPYADGVYEGEDGSPIDITDCYAHGKSRVGGGSNQYTNGWDRIFANKPHRSTDGDRGSCAPEEGSAPKEEEHSVKPVAEASA